MLEIAGGQKEGIKKSASCFLVNKRPSGNLGMWPDRCYDYSRWRIRLNGPGSNCTTSSMLPAPFVW